MDDPILKKARTNASALICMYWNHRQGYFVKGLNFVSLPCQAGELALPIFVEFIEKAEEKSSYTKNEDLRVDSWYATFENLNAVLDLGHHFGVALESSCTVAWSKAELALVRFQALDISAFPFEQPLRALLQALQLVVLVSRHVFTNKKGSQSVIYPVRSDKRLD